MVFNVRFAARGASADCRCDFWLINDFSAQLVLYMRTDDVVEHRFSLESELACPPGVDAFGPAGNDSLDELVRLAADARGHLVPGNTVQGLDLLTDRARHARHREVDARAELLARKARSVDEKADGGAWTRVRMPDALGNRQQRLLSSQRFADDA